VQLSSHFRYVPLEAVDRLIFASHNFTAQDLYSILEPMYEGDETLQESQKMLFEQALPEILEKWAVDERTMLHRFVEFCTGQSYLPDMGSTFKIYVKFETESVEGNSSSEERLPESHTCERILSLPKSAYGSDSELFEKKLRQSIENGYEQFTQH
jgi:hypothetical protein